MLLKVSIQTCIYIIQLAPNSNKFNQIVSNFENHETFLDGFRPMKQHYSTLHGYSTCRLKILAHIFRLLTKLAEKLEYRIFAIAGVISEFQPDQHFRIITYSRRLPSHHLK